ncbi:hypothetical protein DFQ26_000206 [Actinomortierella ambigua]|nr:hypothetical protein DFQ26_000206 [Actinomortierella ambigua]
MANQYHDFDTSAKIGLVLGRLSANPQLCLSLKITFNRNRNADAASPSIRSIYHSNINDSSIMVQWLKVYRSKSPSSHLFFLPRGVLLLSLSTQRGCRSQLTAAIESMPAGNSSGSSSRSMMGAASASSATKSAASGLHSTAFPIQATTGSVGRMAPTMAFTPATSSPRRRYSPQHFYQNRILDPYVHQTVTPITLRQLVFFGRNMQPDKLLKSANYVRTELPVRLAHRIRDFQNLPFIVGTNPHIELVYDLYWQAFEKLRKVPEIKTLDDNEKFCELVKGLLNDHLVVIPQLALGIMECSKHIPPEVVDQFMNKMLRSRISRRVLAEQHISLTANYNSPNHMMADRGYIGIIYTHCNPRDIVERTALLAAETCRQAIGGGIEPPKVVLDGNIDAEFSYIPDHIEYILYELLKNSMRFVMLRNNEPNSQQPGGELPPIQITVCEGTHDIVFRISDRGGGIDPETEKYLWSYAQQSARFANFEKVSRMAATVQEQLVSPSRGTSSPQDVEEEEEDEEDIAYKSGGVAATAADNDDSSHDDDESVVLPPPPKPVASRRDAKSGSKDKVTPVIQLDRHAREQYRLKKQHQHQQQQQQQHSTGAAAASPTPQMIDPSQQRGQPVAKKVGHLDPRQQQDTAVHLGIGLPMSKVYAEYWGGDLKVFTMHGYGTDAYAKFCKFGNIYENFNV